MLDGVAAALEYADTLSSTALACSVADAVPLVATLMASTPRLSSRVAGTFTAGQVTSARSWMPHKGLLAPKPFSGNAAAAAPAGQRPRAGTVASWAHETTPAGTGSPPGPVPK